MRYLALAEVLALHDAIIRETGGVAGIRDFAALESALAQPKATFGGAHLHPALADKAAALCFSLVLNHSFLDGNKRVGHAAMETFLVLNGSEVEASIDEQERINARDCGRSIEPWRTCCLASRTHQKTVLKVYNLLLCSRTRTTLLCGNPVGAGPSRRAWRGDSTGGDKLLAGLVMAPTDRRQKHRQQEPGSL